MDDWLRREFHEAAPVPSRSLAVEAIRGEARRRRRRKRLAVTAATLLVVAVPAAAAIGWWVERDGDAVVLAPDDGDAGPGGEAGDRDGARNGDGGDGEGGNGEDGAGDPVAATPSPAVRPPRTLAVSTVLGVQVVEAASGAVRLDRSQVLSQRAVGIGEVALAPDGATMYVAATVNAYISEIYRVPAQGPRELVVEGRDPAVSPDGTKLAYTQEAINRARNPQAAVKDEIVVRDLASGQQRTWKAEEPLADPGLPADVRSLTWGPQSQRLAFELVYEDGSEVRVLDTTQGDSVLDSRELEPPAGTAYESPAYRGQRGTLAVVQARGGLDPEIAPEEFSVVEVDPATGEVGATLVERPGQVRTLDFDATGRHLLFTAVAPDDPGRTRVFAWSGGQATRVPFDGGVSAAAW